MYAKRMKQLEKGDEPFTLHTVKGFSQNLSFKLLFLHPPDKPGERSIHPSCFA